MLIFHRTKSQIESLKRKQEIPKIFSKNRRIPLDKQSIMSYDRKKNEGNDPKRKRKNDRNH